MKRWARWSLIGIAGVIAVTGAAVGVGTFMAERKMHRTVQLAVVAVTLPDDLDRIEHGRYLYESRGCAECHGKDGGGRMAIDDGSFRVRGPQISRGPNSATVAYREVDWVRAVRHGVDPSGRPLIVMPSEDYNRLTDTDLGALVAYIRQMPEVTGLPRVIELPLPVRVLYGYGAIEDAASKIDHTLPPEVAVAEGATAEHGRYVANMCIGCHGSGFSGGKVPGGPPNWPATANLTPGEGSAMSRYPDAEAFATMLRTGKRPDGAAIAVMPFEALSKLSDTDISALYAFLKTLPPRPAGNR
jgi:mono/diheme cytochrome c family protein